MLCGHRDTPLLGKQTVLIGEERLSEDVCDHFLQGQDYCFVFITY